MIELRRPAQYSLGDGLIQEQTADLWQPWMRHADKALEDEKLRSQVVAVESANTPGDPKGPRLQGQLSKRVKRSDVDVRACGKRTANALGALTRIAAGGMTASRVNAKMTLNLTRRNAKITRNNAKK
jgi:hypothetical protein